MAKVLVVDDSLSVRKVVERALVGRQIEVVCAATGSEALERIERDEPDVVVCDVVMPDKDGYEICDFVKRHPRLGRTPVLLMSGIVNDAVRERAARVQSADVLSKPFAADDLLRRLDTLLTPPRREAPAAPADPPVARPEPVTPAPLSVAAPALNGSNGHVEPPLAAPPPTVAAADAVMPPAPPALPAATGTTAVLRQFAAIDGVQWAVLADREGFLLDASAEDAVGAEVAGALSACLAESSEGLGRELGRGPLQGMILEYEQGLIVLYGVGASALLAVALGEPAVLGKVRYFAKKAVPELLQAV
ncbi:MAG TPA: response regulator [Methylomirabilota bacterium]|jgi:CheY-like chemotaxis protein/predicted regulator of Ras-like GTPase activity (Roadblock/LC7/MglB family)